MIYNLNEKNSIANQFLIELRDCNKQQDAMRFRKNMERLGSIMAYEISKKLFYITKKVNTPLGSAEHNIIEIPPVLVTVMRAGLPYFEGFMNFFDSSEGGFVGAYRKEDTAEVTINLEYLATPSLAGRDVILIDPMLATGRSFIKSVQSLMKHGEPRHFYLASLIAAPEGIQYIKENMATSFSIWTFGIDEKLNEKFYIVPGLGDAGDLSYGQKL